MPRRPRLNQAGYIFHVLNRGAGRKTLFDKDLDYDAFVNLLENARQKISMRILAYCVMPNHWHLVLWPENENALSEYMRWLTVTHSQRWNAHHEAMGTGPVYQGRFKSFPIEADEHLTAVLRYVERNALRAQLCARAEDWKWSSAWCLWTSNYPVELTECPISKPKEWLHYLNQPQSEIEASTIRHSVNSGRPYGNNSWVRNTAQSLGIMSTLRSRQSGSGIVVASDLQFLVNHTRPGFPSP